MEWGSNGREARDRARGIDWRVTMIIILPDQDAYGRTDGAVNIRSNIIQQLPVNILDRTLAYRMVSILK